MTFKAFRQKEIWKVGYLSFSPSFYLSSCRRAFTHISRCRCQSISTQSSNVMTTISRSFFFVFFFLSFFSVFIREYFRTLHGFFSFFLTPLPCGIHQITGLGNPSFFYPFLLSSNRWGQTCYLPASFSSSAFSSSVYFCFYLVSLV